MARQPGPAISAPPSVGPSAVPTADMVPSSPMALPALSLGSRSPTNAIVSAIITAAPMPCATRAATNCPSVAARPQAADASVNTAMPASSKRRRPAMSPSRPAPTTHEVIASR
ncbi:Uncharacterised protein [Achromobacter ruhlandii]|nr:Uncharacterised protein [Achromobacter ruhlandii]